MRILHVSPTAFGDTGIFGGGERYPLELALALARLDGVECELVTFGPTTRVEQIGDLRVRVLRARGHLHRHPAHPLALGLVNATRDVDVVHAHHLFSTPSRLSALLGSARRRPFAVTDHGLAGGTWMGILPRLVDQFLLVSQYSSEVLASPPQRTTVVYGGADPDRFHPDGSPRDGVLFVGRLTPHKGVDRLIEALPPYARLTVVGTGGHDRNMPERDYTEHLRRLAAGKDVQFLGAVGDHELPRLYRRAAVVAVPSVHRTCYGKQVAVSELLGLSTLEAMASGTAVVASRVGGLVELVVDGITGYLVEPGDVRALRSRLELVLDDTVAAASLGEAGRERVLERFTWDACAHRCVSAYRAMLS
jgi:glycosyltransferase involved in cell wall biosynthesis